MQEHFARLSSMIALSCLIEDQKTLYPGRFYVLLAIWNTDFRLPRFKLQVFIHGPKYLRKQWNRQYQLYTLAGTFFVSLIGIYFGCTLSLPWYYFVHTGLVVSRIIPWLRARGLGALNKPWARFISFRGRTCGEWGYTNFLLPESADSGAHPFFGGCINLRNIFTVYTKEIKVSIEN